MLGLRRNVLLSVTGLVALVSLQVLSSHYKSIEDFIGTPLGVLLRTALISSLVLPHVPTVLNASRRRYVRDRLLTLLAATAINNTSLDIPRHRKLFRSLFGRGPLSRVDLGTLSPTEAALLLLGLQYYHRELPLDKNVCLADIIDLAARASQDQQYRQLLFALSLHGLPLQQRSSLADALGAFDAQTLPVRQESELADMALFERLDRAQQPDTLYMFSTTSQVSNLSFSLLRARANRIAALNIFMVSPLLLSEGALRSLAEEYDVPTAALPKAQFIPDRTLDLVRRVIRVLSGIEYLIAFRDETRIPIRLFLFRKEHPGIKIRLLVGRSYAQVFPGCLKYANNIYRFGAEVVDRNVIDDVVGGIRDLIGDADRVRECQLDVAHFRLECRHALGEAYRYLLTHGQQVSELDRLRPLLRMIVKSPSTDEYVQTLVDLDRAVTSTIEQFEPPVACVIEADVREALRFDDRDVDNNIGILRRNGTTKHVSVGVVIVRDGRVLLLRKRQAPYVARYSIVAGHVAPGESPLVALRREVQEEIGVLLETPALLKHYDNIPGDLCRYGVANHEWFVFLTDAVGQQTQLTVDAGESERAEWIPFERLPLIGDLTFASRRILDDLGVL